MNITRLLLSAVPALVITLLLRRIFGISRPKGVKLVESARRAGRTVEATLVQQSYLRPYGNDELELHRQGRWALTYEYGVQGRTYRYRITVEGDPPERMTLYYPAGKPEKAISEMEAPAKAGGAHLFSILLPVLLWVVFYRLLAR